MKITDSKSADQAIRERKKDLNYTQTILTNMCMVCDGEYILVEDKQNSSYTGVTFSGGHIEAGESLTDSIIREVFEESGLLIQNSKLCGIYDWMAEENVRYLVLIYKATEFSGSLCSSEEGQVRWIRKEDFLKEKLAHGMDKVFEIVEGETFTECFMDLETRREMMF